jgi:hypothetical protein
LYERLLKKNGLNLRYASIDLQNNYDIVLDAVKQNGMAYNFASNELKLNEEIALEAIRRNRNIISNVPSEITSNKSISEAIDMFHYKIHGRTFR